MSTFYHNLITSWWPQNDQSIFASPRWCLGVWYLSEGLAWDNKLRDSCTPALQCGDANLWLLIRWCGRRCPRRNGRCRFHLRSGIRSWKVYHHRCSHCGRSGRVGLADRDQRCTSPSCCTHCRTSRWIALIQAGSWKAVWRGFTRRWAVTSHPDLNVVEFLLMGSRLGGYSSLLLLGSRQTMWMTGLPHSIGWKQVMMTNHNILHSKQQCIKYWNILTSKAERSSAWEQFSYTVYIFLFLVQITEIGLLQMAPSPSLSNCTICCQFLFFVDTTALCHNFTCLVLLKCIVLTCTSLTSHKLSDYWFLPICHTD